MSPIGHILSRVSISDVCRALGIEPQRGRIPAPWRETRDRNVSLNDATGVYCDHADGDKGGGILDLVSRVRGCSRQDALRFVAGLAGVRLDETPTSVADRRRWARERREMERDLPAAQYWRRTAVLLCDEELVLLKAALFDPPTKAPVPDEIAWWTREHTRLRRLDGAGLVEVHREAMKREPAVTAAMVQWGKNRELVEIRALLRYLGDEAVPA